MHNYALILYVIISIFVIYLALIRSGLVPGLFLLSSVIYSRIAEDYFLSILGVRLSYDFLILICIMLIALPRNFNFNKLDFILFYLIICVSMIGVLNYWSFSVAEIFINGFLSCTLFYFIVNYYIRTEADISKSIFFLFLIAVVSFVYGVLQPILNGNILDYFNIRSSSFYYSPTIFASVCLLLWPFLFCMNLATNLKISLMALGVGSLLLAGSRGPLVVFVVQILVWLLISKRLQNFTINIGKSIVFILVILTVVVNYWDILLFVLRRFFAEDWLDSGSSAFERYLGILAAFELISEFPLIGVGLGGFQNMYKSTKYYNHSELDLESAHNLILNIGAEQGIIVMILISILFCIFNYRWLILVFSKSIVFDKRLKSILILFFISLLGFTTSIFLFGGEFVHKMSATPMLMFFLIAGISVRFKVLSKRI